MKIETLDLNTLYEQEYDQWLEKTVKILKNRREVVIK